MARTIQVKSYNKVLLEANAGEAINPGQLIKFDPASANTGNVIKHASGDSVDGPVMVALEQESFGKGTGTADAYKANDKVKVWVPGPGDEAMLRVGTAGTYEEGSLVESKGDGNIKSASSGNKHFGYVATKLASASGDDFIHVRFTL